MVYEGEEMLVFPGDSFKWLSPGCMLHDCWLKKWQYWIQNYMGIVKPAKEQEICIYQDRLSSNRLVCSYFWHQVFFKQIGLKYFWHWQVFFEQIGLKFLENYRFLQAGYFEFLTYWVEVIWTIRCFFEKDWFYNLTGYGPKSPKNTDFRRPWSRLNILKKD